MNQVTYTMQCGCRVNKENLVKKLKINKSGNKCIAICCPDHDKGFLSYRERKCLDCDEIVYQKVRRSRIALRCTSCTSENTKINARAYAKIDYAKKQSEKDLKVNNNFNFIDNIKTGMKKKIVIIKNYKVSKIIRARSESDAFLKGINFIPVEGLIKMHRSMYA